VGRAILEVMPYGVDVSTGVEKSAGRKSLQLMKKFAEEVRKV
jgi:phosphoribosylanthranilate isomerase